MSTTNPNKFNILIAILSIGASIIYFFSTVPAYIELLECNSCQTTRDMSLMHYWYRWVLFGLLAIAGLRLMWNLKGTRRMYYLFFAGLLFITIHDLVKEIADLNMYGIFVYAVLPGIISILGFIYFKTYYKTSLKRG